MTKKKWAIGIAAVGILGGGAFYLAPTVQEGAVIKSDTVKQDKFDDLKEVEVEIMDTSTFSDEHLEKWFKENEAKKGEALYFDNTHTYILVSAGEESKDNEIIWLDGLRSAKETLVVGYEFKDGKEYGVKNEGKHIPTLLIRTEGEFKKVKGVVVEKPEVKPEPVKVTEDVKEGDKVADKKEAKKVEKSREESKKEAKEAELKKSSEKAEKSAEKEDKAE